MTAPNDFNEKVITEFRANGGKVGGWFEGAPMMLLTTTGAKSGKQYTTPLVYMSDGDRMIIFASKAGDPKNPAWYHNLLAHHDATVEVGTEKIGVHAEITAGAERDRLYDAQSKVNPRFAEYQAKTTRLIPVVALTRRGG